MGAFKKLQASLEAKGYSAKAAGGIAYNAGKKKYGKKVMSEAAKEHVSAKSIVKNRKESKNHKSRRHDKKNA